MFSTNQGGVVIRNSYCVEELTCPSYSCIAIDQTNMMKYDIKTKGIEAGILLKLDKY